MAEKSERLSGLLKKINDPAWKEEMKRKRAEYKESLTAEYQLGYFVGEDVIHRYLPTLNVEGGTLKEISVTSEEQRKYNRLTKEWYDKCKLEKDGNTNSKDEWNEYQSFRKELIEKYLPNPLVCHERIINIRNMNEFKEGFIFSLWDCDCCNYSLEPEDIEIYEDGDYFTVIKLKLK